MKKVLHGLMEDQLGQLEDNSVDAVVTDPPYGLRFMGKKWDYSVPTVKQWLEVFRVLKPGGHILSFGGTRTYHRMVVNIEDAGFEIRDCISWIYGSGFPKSMNISKAIQKDSGEPFEDTGVISPISRPNVLEDLYKSGKVGKNFTIKNVTTDLAKQWDGWGTALKPAVEMVCMARKPLIGTVVENILEHGVGGINIDACRIGTERRSYKGMSANKPEVGTFRDDNWVPKDINVTVSGRFPANVILDEEAGRLLDIQSGTLKSGDSKGFKGEYTADVYGKYANNLINPDTIYADSGGASRFFYCAKASKAERNAGLEHREPKKVSDGSPAIADNAFQRAETMRVNTHPTVKPVKLMEYLVKLVTPPDGVVLDPFAGSMTTGIACLKLGKSFIMIEADQEHYEMGKERLKAFNNKLKAANAK